MTKTNYLNMMKQDFGFGRCEDVPEEIAEMLIIGEEEEDTWDDEPEYPSIYDHDFFTN